MLLPRVETHPTQLLQSPEGSHSFLTLGELEAVLAHELGHVKNRDILISTIAAVLAGVVTTIAHYGMYFGNSYNSNSDDNRPANPIFVLLLVLLAPLAARLDQPWHISLKRI